MQLIMVELARSSQIGLVQHIMIPHHVHIGSLLAYFCLNYIFNRMDSNYSQRIYSLVYLNCIVDSMVECCSEIHFQWYMTSPYSYNLENRRCIASIRNHTVGGGTTTESRGGFHCRDIGSKVNQEFYG